MYVTVCLKLVSRPRYADHLQSAPAGRLEGGSLEMDPASRTALEAALALPQAQVTVLTMGPQAAEPILREALALGATQAIHLCDPALAGADTLATAGALAAAIRTLPAQTLLLTGQRSWDSETGHIGPALAQLLGLPFAGGAAELTRTSEGFAFTVPEGGEERRYAARGPLVLSLCCGAGAARLPSIRGLREAAGRPVRRVTAGELGFVPVSPTRVVRSEPLDYPRRAGVALTLRQLAAYLLPADDPVREPPAWATDSSAAGTGAYLAVLTGDEPRQLALAAFAAGLPGGGWAVRLDCPPGAESLRPAVQALLSLPGLRQLRGILLPATPLGRMLAPMLAAALGAGCTADCTDLTPEDGRLLQTRPAQGGRRLARIVTDGLCVVTARPGTLPPARGAVPLLRLPVAPEQALRPVELRRSGTVPLREARVILAGGAGLGSRERFAALEALAALCGAGVGASRGAVAAGFAPRSLQIGQTGTAVRPAVYVALGISGAAQHLCGITGAGTVLAVNTAPRPPIRDYCDGYLTGDAGETIRALTEQLTERLKEEKHHG